MSNSMKSRSKQTIMANIGLAITATIAVFLNQETPVIVLAALAVIGLTAYELYRDWKERRRIGR